MADDQFVPEGEACGMPVARQIERLQAVLASSYDRDVVLHSTDLYGLPDAERNAALDAVVAGTPSPYVLVDGRIVCDGAVDPDSVIEALVRLHDPVA